MSGPALELGVPGAAACNDMVPPPLLQLLPGCVLLAEGMHHADLITVMGHAEEAGISGLDKLAGEARVLPGMSVHSREPRALLPFMRSEQCLLSVLEAQGLEPR